eukprot:GSChrysophyteH1.ASY1.ANO1.666.1 assembled CDS
MSQHKLCQCPLISATLTKFVLNHGMVEVDVLLMNLTAKYGCLESVKILRAREPPCPWNEGTCDCAAYCGHLDVLQWLRSQDPPCPWDKYTCSCAARGGHVVFGTPPLMEATERLRSRRNSWIGYPWSSASIASTTSSSLASPI